MENWEFDCPECGNYRCTCVDDTSYENLPALEDDDRFVKFQQQFLFHDLASDIIYDLALEYGVSWAVIDDTYFDGQRKYWDIYLQGKEACEDVRRIVEAGKARYGRSYLGVYKSFVLD